MTEALSLGERLNSVRVGIDTAARASDRSPDDISLIVVTKFHPEQLVRDLFALGVRDVGENRHQEAAEKSAACSDLSLRWHFIGQLQSNKARSALEYADVIHSVDRPSLVTALNRAWTETEPGRAPVDCFIQLNLTENPDRGGVSPANLESLTEMVSLSPALHLLGLMAVAPLDKDPAQAFEIVARESQRLREWVPEARFISTGMSHDYPEAIAAGATHLRIGSAITGNRPLRG